jgi:hypothetical protein
MRSTVIDRRRMLALAAAALAAPVCARDPGRAAGAARAAYLSACADAAGQHRVRGFDARGRLAFDLALPGRGHAFALRPDARIAVNFARRPGRFAAVLDLRRGVQLHTIETPYERHFQGHGTFSHDGRMLYACENDFDAARGVLGVYDAAQRFRRVAELPTHGIGPHDVRLLSDGVTLAVANGGIATHPDWPRLKLNVPDMAPSLAYVDRRDGRLLEAVRLAPQLHQLGIRHLALGHADNVAIAMQYEGPAGDEVPLVATHRRGDALRLCNGPPAMQRAMRHYCGSVAFDRAGQVLAVSAPRGNLITCWDAMRGAYLCAVQLADGCGIAPAPRPGRFLASSGRGGALEIDARSGRATPVVSAMLAAAHWDNHLAAVAAQP